MFKRILVAVDNSNRSERAVQQAVTLARRACAEIILAHVIEPDGVTDKDWATVTYAERKHVATHLLNRFAKTVPMKITTELLEGKVVARELTQLATRRASDLIVIGTHGRTGLARWIQGSVAEEVLRRAMVPVMLIRDVEVFNVNESSLQRVLVTTDGTALSRDALHVARDFANGLHAELFVLNVMPDPGLPPAVGPTPIDQKALRRDLELESGLILNEAICELESPRAQPLLIAEHGRHVSEAIVHAARDHGMDLIIMGTHGRSGFDRFLVGSVAQGVSCRAEVPVLLVKSGQGFVRDSVPILAENTALNRMA
jgi:nucleotide-binding universal stress UspA family protein